ncbi:MAG TPA: hypothetical protein VK557_02560 [Pyrinomonadaceae bacterium]|nr:hypothetical protein [Pyrinomonadaceae bacterium]
MAGYSGTPLVEKLGIKEGFDIAFVNAPENFVERLDLPRDVKIRSLSKGPDLDFILVFVKSQKILTNAFAQHSHKIKPNGMFWVSWPKKTSGVQTDVTENIVRDIGLAAGLVDVKVCAIDDVWSGLKFVYRLKDRRR